MWRSASRDRGLAKVVKRVAGRLPGVVRDDRGVLVEITKVEPAAAELANVEIVCLLADARSYLVAIRTGLFHARGDRVAHGFLRDGGVHGVTRNLLGDRQAFHFIGVQ